MESGLISWNIARPIAKHYFQFWPDGEDLLWAKACWAAVEKSGLAVYHTEQEEMACRSLVGLLALFYQEFSWRLGVDSFLPLRDEHLQEIFCSSSDDVEAGLIRLRGVLQDKYGLDELYHMTLLSVESGRQGARMPTEIAAEYENCTKYGPESMGPPFERAFSLINGATLHPDHLEAIPYIPRGGQ